MRSNDYRVNIVLSKIQRERRNLRISENPDGPISMHNPYEEEERHFRDSSYLEETKKIAREIQQRRDSMELSDILNKR